MRESTCTTPTWNGADRCPFCEDELASPGAGFIDHIRTSPGCEANFDGWRGRVRDDMTGGWSG